MRTEESIAYFNVRVAQLVERRLAKAKVAGSSPVSHSKFLFYMKSISISSYSYIQGLSHIWKIPSFPKHEICSLAIDLHLNPTIAALLYARGYKTSKDAHNFLFPIYDNQIYHPKYMKNATTAALRIQKAILNKEKILIAGDYDVDGITSTSLAMKALLNLGANVNFFLPDRKIDGYGLSVKTIKRAKQHGYKLIITVDNGISAFDALKEAKLLDIDVVVTDHHQPPNPMPEGAFCIVNPHQEGCDYPFKELAGVGVSFKLMTYLYEIFEKPFPQELYELFLLGTIADVVPLIDENRFLVATILKDVNKKNSPAILTLKKNAKLESSKHLTSTDIGFSLTPQLNALGRLENPRSGVLFFLSKEEEELSSIGYHLWEINNKRKVIEKKLLETAEELIQKEKYDHKKNGCLVLSGNDWNPGIVGLVAAKLVQKYGVPVAILHETNDGFLKGSLRSIPECDLYECLKNLPKELLINYGGHMGAAGITIKKSDITKFRELFGKEVKKICCEEDLQPKIKADGVLDVNEISDKLWQEMSLLEPFGAHNQQPTFYLSSVYLTEEPQLIKDLHTKIKLASTHKPISVVFFNRPDIYTILTTQKISHIDIIGKLTQNTWNNKTTIEIIGLDIAI